MSTTAFASSGLAGDPGECDFVLVIEREEPLRTLLRWLIEDGSCCVLVARDAGEASRLPELPSVSLILADGSEPGIGGEDGLRNRLAPGAWLLWFNRDGMDLLDLCDENRAVVLTGPFRTDVLAERVRELLATR